MHRRPNLPGHCSKSIAKLLTHESNEETLFSCCQQDSHINDPKLSDSDLEARVCVRRREAKARHVPGFMAGAHAVTEPVEVTPAAPRQLNARVAVRCSAWLGVAVSCTREVLSVVLEFVN